MTLKGVSRIMRIKNLLLIGIIGLTSISANADWAVAPGLTSSTLWQMVVEGRANVVSSVAFGGPRDVHIKQTVFKVSSTMATDKNIKWAVRPGVTAPIMCTEKWNGIDYHGSSCSIPGVLDPSDLSK